MNDICLGFATLRLSYADLERVVALLEQPDVEAWLLEIGDAVHEVVDPTAATSPTGELLGWLAEGPLIRAGVTSFLPEGFDDLPPLARLQLYLVALVDVAQQLDLDDRFAIATDAMAILVLERDALAEIKQRYHREQGAVSAFLYLRAGDDEDRAFADGLAEALGLDLEADLTRMARLVRSMLRRAGAGSLVREVEKRDGYSDPLVVESRIVLTGAKYFKKIDPLRALAQALDGKHRILPTRVADRMISENAKVHRRGKIVFAALDEDLIRHDARRETDRRRAADLMADWSEKERAAFVALVLSSSKLTQRNYAKRLKVDPSTLRKRRRQARSK